MSIDRRILCGLIGCLASCAPESRGSVLRLSSDEDIELLQTIDEVDNVVVTGEISSLALLERDVRVRLTLTIQDCTQLQSLDGAQHFLASTDPGVPLPSVTVVNNAQLASVSDLAVDEFSSVAFNGEHPSLERIELAGQFEGDLHLGRLSVPYALAMPQARSLSSLTVLDHLLCGFDAPLLERIGMVSIPAGETCLPAEEVEGIRGLQTEP